MEVRPFAVIKLEQQLQTAKPEKLMLLLKCQLIIQMLPENALEEAAYALEEIYDFYTRHLGDADLPPIPGS